MSTSRSRPSSVVERRLFVISFGTIAIALVFGGFQLNRLLDMRVHLDSLASEHASNLLDVGRLRSLSDQIEHDRRNALLGRDRSLLDRIESTHRDLQETLARLRANVTTPSGQSLLTEVVVAEEGEHTAFDQAVREALASPGAAVSSALRAREERLDAALGALTREERRAFENARRDALAEGRWSARVGTALSVAGGLTFAVLGAVLWRTLRRLRASHASRDDLILELEHKNQDLDAFAGRVAHDIRGVLVPISGAPELLRERAGSATAVSAVADQVERAAKRIVGIVDGLLAFARAAHPAEIAAPADVRAAVDAVVTDLERHRQAAAAAIVLDVDPIAVLCAPNLLYVTLRNLVDNALKFLEGRPERSVRLAARAATPEVAEIVVQDSGPGIPPEAQARIFEPLYRVPGTRAHGAGIGLATVRRIVEMHGGEIRVQSTPGQGAEFTIRLPLAPSPQDRR